MNRITKKIMIYSLAGMMQLGLGASVIEASPLHVDGTSGMVQLDNRHGNRDEQKRQENERHEREMRRHNNESDRDWNDRQQRENQRHDNTMNEIIAGVIGIVIGSQL